MHGCLKAASPVHVCLPMDCLSPVLLGDTHMGQKREEGGCLRGRLGCAALINCAFPYVGLWISMHPSGSELDCHVCSAMQQMEQLFKNFEDHALTKPDRPKVLDTQLDRIRGLQSSMLQALQTVFNTMNGARENQQVLYPAICRLGSAVEEN